MAEILAFLPTYSPDTEATNVFPRPYERQTQEQIAGRINALLSHSREKPWVYMDVIDSVLNTNPDIDLVVADARSTDSIRTELHKHQVVSGKYSLALYPEKMSQWAVFNDVWKRHATEETKYFVYTSSDIIFTHDWIAEAVKEFEKYPALMIVFPTVSSGDPAMPLQVATGPMDMDLIDPADHMDLGRRAGSASAVFEHVRGDIPGGVFEDVWWVSNGLLELLH